MASIEPLEPDVFGAESPCFGCSPTHPTGFHLRFAREIDEEAGVRRVTTTFTPGPQHQGPPGVMHGGLVTTLADELAAWTVIGLRGRFGFTGAIQAKLHRPLRVGIPALGTGEIVSDARRVITVAVTIEQSGARVFEGSFTFVVLDEKGAERLLGGPLPEAWKRFSRGASHGET